MSVSQDKRHDTKEGKLNQHPFIRASSRNKMPYNNTSDTKGK
jgi:hypothetical protein